MFICNANALMSLPGKSPMHADASAAVACEHSVFKGYNRPGCLRLYIYKSVDFLGFIQRHYIY